MTAPTVVLDAFRKLEAKLDSLYGKNHKLDFEAEMTNLEKAILAPPVVVKPVVPVKVTLKPVPVVQPASDK